jgi:hypothetical protein
VPSAVWLFEFELPCRSLRFDCYLAYKTGIFSISLHWIEQDFGKRRLLPVTLTRMIITVHGFTHNEAVYAARTCALPQEKNE